MLVKLSLDYYYDNAFTLCHIKVEPELMVLKTFISLCPNNFVILKHCLRATEQKKTFQMYCLFSKYIRDSN